MKLALLHKYRKAIELNSNLGTPRSQAHLHPGHSEAYYELFGLSRKDLKNLERLGCAVRGYTNNYWGPGQTLPSGNVVNEEVQYRGPGHRLRWLLITEEQDAEESLSSLRAESSEGTEVLQEVGERRGASNQEGGV